MSEYGRMDLQLRAGSRIWGDARHSLDPSPGKWRAAAVSKVVATKVVGGKVLEGTLTAINVAGDK